MAGYYEEIEKELTESVLKAGQLSFDDYQAEALGLSTDLSAQSKEVKIAIENEEVTAWWEPPKRILGGEQFGEVLRERSQIGDWALIKRSQGRLRLEIGASSDRTGAILQAEHQRPQAPSRLPKSPPKKETKRRVTQRLREERTRIRLDSEFDWRGAVGIHRATSEQFAKKIASADWACKETVDLLLRGEHLVTFNDFDELIAINLAKIDHLPHQEATALQVLGPMKCRAILADEVGLGKTIEAGIIIKELIERGLAHRILILTPASLREQWRLELNEKFDEDFVIIRSGGEPLTETKLIMSLELARLRLEEIVSFEWDLVVVDEAHKLTGQDARRTRALMTGLRAARMLLLTATPVQNNLLELYRLVSILRPGTFRSPRQFKREFIDPSNPRRPTKPDVLRRMLSRVMVRTTRKQAEIHEVQRHPHDEPFNLTESEAELYKLCVETLRSVMVDHKDHLRRRHLVHRLTISPECLQRSCERIAKSHPDRRVRQRLNEIAELAGSIDTGARVEKAGNIVRQWIDQYGRVVVFTQHLDAAEAIIHALDEAGIKAEPFHGQMSAYAKQDAIQKFASSRNNTEVLVCTQAGAEGLNLQVANCVLNFDLPWNPMKLEQRIGRVHRIGQTKDVHIVNLYAKDTIDEHVYYILREKIGMFELLFGHITAILAEVNEKAAGDNFEQKVERAFLSPDDQEMKRQLAELAETYSKARRRAEELERESELNQWLDDLSSSKTTRKQKSNSEGPQELVPKKQASRARHKKVAQWVKDCLRHIGADIKRHRNGLLVANLPEIVASELERPHTLYLALRPDALQLDANAELCVPGAAILDEFLWLLQKEGNVYAQVKAPAEETQNTPVKHTSDVQLVRQALHGTWRAQAYWRVTDDQGKTEIIETSSGWEGPLPALSPVPAEELHAAWHRQSGNAYYQERELIAGERLPDGSPPPKEIIAYIAEKAYEKLTELSHRKHEQLVQEVQPELEEITEGIAQRKAELALTPPGTSEAEGLAEEIKQLEDLKFRLTTLPEPRLRAELLALRLYGNEPYIVREIWHHKSGATATLEFPWGTDTLQRRGNDGHPISVLSMCCDGHIIDASRRIVCPSCESVLCDLCGKKTVFSNCQICRESKCGICSEKHGPLCRRCAKAIDSLSRIGKSEKVSLPDELFAGRMRIRRAATENREFVLIQGACRRELVWLEEGSIRAWFSFGEESQPATELAFDLASSGIGDGDWKIRFKHQSGPRAPSRPHLKIADHFQPVLRLQSRGTSFFSRKIYTEKEVSTAEEAARIVKDSLPRSASLYPQQAPPSLVELVQKLWEPPQTSADELVVRAEVESKLIWIDLEGVHSYSSKEGTTRKGNASWQKIPEPPEWAVQSLPVAESGRVLSCSLAEEDLDCLVLCWGYSVVLGIRKDQRVDWFQAQGDPIDRIEWELGAFFYPDAPRPLKVAEATFPEEAVFVELQGARLKDRSLSPRIRPASASPSPDLSMKALRVWYRGGRPELIELPRLPQENSSFLKDLTERAFGVVPDPQVVGLGIHVLEVWVRDGIEKSIKYNIEAGEREGRIRTEDRGRLLNKAILDSSGHITEASAACSYCRRQLCDRCKLGVRTCQLCRTGVCTMCAAHEYIGYDLCRACSSLKRTGRRVLKALGLDAGQVERCYLGTDQIHTVALIIINPNAATVARIQGSRIVDQRSIRLPHRVVELLTKAR